MDDLDEFNITSDDIELMIAAEAAQSAKNTPIPAGFSAGGISLRQITSFIRDVCGGEEAIQGKSVEQVKWDHLLSYVNEYQMSYLEIVHKSNPDISGGSTIPIANVYIIYSWKDKFLDVVASLQHELKDPNVLVWWDFFSLNQYSLPEVSFTYLGETIRSMMDHVDKVVFCYSPLTSSTPLSRTWCLWELFCAADAQKTLEVAMLVRKEHVLDLLENIDSSFSAIRITTSESSLFEDKAQIMEVITATIGFAAVEEKIILLLRKWLINVYQGSLASCSKGFTTKATYTYDFVNFCIDRRLFSDAERVSRDLIRKLTDRFGEGSVKTISAIVQLGAVLEASGRDEEAVELFYDCWQIQHKLLGSYHRSTLQTLEKLATLSELLCQPQSSAYYEELYKQRKLRKSASAKEDVIDTVTVDKEMDRLDKLLDIGKECDEAGHYDEAETMYTAAWEIQKTKFGALDIESLATMQTLGAVIESAGRIDEARTLYQQCLQMKIASLGEVDFSTLLTSHALALLELRAGNYDEAERQFKELLDSHQMRIENDTPDEEMLLALKDYADLLSQKGCHEDALGQYSHLLTLRKRMDRQNNTDGWSEATLAVLDLMATTHEKMDQLEEAENTLLECWERKQGLLGHEHASTLSTMLQLGLLYKKKGIFNDAKRLLLAHWDISKKAFGEESKQSLLAMFQLGLLYYESNMYTEASVIFEQCHQRMTKTLGINHPDSIRCDQLHQRAKASNVQTGGCCIIS